MAEKYSTSTSAAPPQTAPEQAKPPATISEEQATLVAHKIGGVIMTLYSLHQIAGFDQFDDEPGFHLAQVAQSTLTSACRSLDLCLIALGSSRIGYFEDEAKDLVVAAQVASPLVEGERNGE